jgi:hypothetical protein
MMWRYLSLNSGGKWMQTQKGCFLVLALTFFGFLNSANATELPADARRLAFPEGARYAADYPELKKLYQDEAVTAAFERAESDTEEFLKSLASTSVAHTHSPEWISHCQKAVSQAKASQWKNVQEELSLALGEQRDLPDWILFKALADKKVGQLETSVSDLEYLCKIRKERKSGYKTFWEIRNHQPDAYWSSSWFINSFEKKANRDHN